MPQLSWFRLYSEARNDRKLRTLTHAEHYVWFNLMCYASDQVERGTIVVEDPVLFALEVGDGDEALVDQTVSKLIELRILRHPDPTTLAFIHWGDRQYDKPSDRPDAVRERVVRHRKGVTHIDDDSSNAMKRHETPETPITEESITEESITEQRRGDLPAAAEPKPRRGKRRQTWGHYPDQEHFTRTLVAECADVFSERQVRDEIERCLAYKTTANSSRLDLTAAKWVRSEATRERDREARNGRSGQPRGVPPSQRYTGRRPSGTTAAVPPVSVYDGYGPDSLELQRRAAEPP